MTTNYFAGNTQWLGLAKETTRGTAAATPTVFVPITSPKWQQHVTVMTDDGLRGSLAKSYNAQQGMQYPELTYSTMVYLDSVFPHILAALGNPDTLSGSADPYTHKTALLNAGQPPSYTLWYNDGAGKCWQIVGAQSSNLQIVAEADKLTALTAGWYGLSAAPVTPPSNTPTTNAPMPSWKSTITVGGVSLGKYSKLDLTIKRNTAAIAVLNGTQTPGAIFSDVLEVTGALDGIYQGSTDTDLQNYLTNNQPAIVLTFAPGADATHSLTLQMSKVVYTDASFDSGAHVAVSSKITALGNTTDALDSNFSPIQAVLTSPVSTAY